ncbi:MAG: T9SS type A sorting domain-containing protein [Bacteroidia bacterium]|nr:T9SS type A sorting domain-containing protein [Bacteroidia bacterium]
MKKLILLSLFLLFQAAAPAQITFEKLIDTLGSNYPFDIQQTLDGGYIYCGRSTDTLHHAILVKLDTIGQISWARTFHDSAGGFFQYIEQMPDSGYLAAGHLFSSGNHNWLLRFDKNGDTLWTRKLPPGGTNSYCHEIASTAQGSLYGLYGQGGPALSYLPYLSVALSNGVYLTTKTYAYPIYANGMGMTGTNDNGFALTGFHNVSLPTGATNVFLIRTNAYGDTLWTKSYDLLHEDIAHAIQQTSDSGFIISGQAYDPSLGYQQTFLLKTNAAGDSLWTKYYYGNSGLINELPLKQIPGGGYLLAGSHLDTLNNNLDVFLIRTNDSGDTLWTKKYGTGNAEAALSLDLCADGGFIIGANDYTNQPNGTTYLIKTDSLGHQLGSTGLASAEFDPEEFRLFPNPNRGLFTVRHPLDQGPHGELLISRINGQVVGRKTLHPSGETEIQATDLAPGIYLVNIHSKLRKYAGRLMIKR